MYSMYIRATAPAQAEMSLVVARAQINKNSNYCTTLIGYLLLALHASSIYYWGVIFKFVKIELSVNVE